MPTAKLVSMPRLLTVGWSNTIFDLCNEAIAFDGSVVFDFRKVTWAAPFGLTVISVTIEKCLRANKDVQYIPPDDNNVRAYLERIGFEQAFIKDGHLSTHKPTSVELKRLAGVDPGCTDALVALIDSFITISDHHKFQMRLHINELMTNGFDHSKSPVGCYACAQWYPKNKNLRISFADGGIGILASLTALKKYSYLKNDAEAIRLAILPGVTSRIGKAGGMGLTYIRNYAKRNKGVLTIVSGKSKVNFYHNKIEVKQLNSAFNGTAVDIRIRPGKDTISPRKHKQDIF